MRWLAGIYLIAAIALTLIFLAMVVEAPQERDTASADRTPSGGAPRKHLRRHSEESEPEIVAATPSPPELPPRPLSDTPRRVSGRLVDEAGKALAGWSVEVHRDGGEVTPAVTDESGGFESTAPGDARILTALPPGFGSTSRRAMTEAAGSAGDVRRRFTLRPGSAIVGRILAAWSAVHVLDHVTATVGGRTPARHIAVDRDGVFVIDDLSPSDDVDVTVRRPGYEPWAERGLRPGDVLDITLEPIGRPISGVVRDTAGRPIPLAWVRFTPREGGLVVQTITGFDGRFTEADTLDLDYDVTVLLPDPHATSEPGVRAGTIHGGRPDADLRVRRPR